MNSSDDHPISLFFRNHIGYGNALHLAFKKMKFPKDPLDATIVSFLWAEWFAKECLSSPFKLYMKYEYWSHNRAVAQAEKDAAENPSTLP